MSQFVQTPHIGVVQPMPPLAKEQLQALRDDIAANGVLVPVTVDQHRRVLDGNNRAAIAAELGIECPTVAVEVADDDAAIDVALTLNCARRHLTQEQKRALIRTELTRRPNDSDRAISRRIGCSPTTVGAVRKGEPSNLDTQSLSVKQREQLEAAENVIEEALKDARGALYSLVGLALTNHVSVAEVVGALAMARLRFLQRDDRDEEVKSFYSEQVYDYVAQVTMWDETLEQFPPNPEADPTPDERAMLINGIAMMGDQNHPTDLVGAE